MVSVVVCIAVVGCGESNRADKQVRMRLESISVAPRVWLRNAAERPARLRQTADRIPANMELHAERLQRTGRFIDERRVRDIEHWRERQPVYRERFERIMRGKPHRIEPTAIVMFI